MPQRDPSGNLLRNVIRSIASERDGPDGHAALSDELEAEQETTAGAVPLTEPVDPVASTIDAMSMLKEPPPCSTVTRQRRGYSRASWMELKVRNTVIYWDLVKRSSIPNEGL